MEEKKIFEKKAEMVTFLRNKIFNNVSAQLSERFREEISLRADRIYRNIAETDEELYWGDKYQIMLRDMQDGELRERTDDQLSGGQTMSAVVALRLALCRPSAPGWPSSMSRPPISMPPAGKIWPMPSGPSMSAARR